MVFKGPDLIKNEIVINNEILELKLNLWLTASKGATPIN